MEKGLNNTGGLCRRGFLKRALAAGASLFIAPSLEKAAAINNAVTDKTVYPDNAAHGMAVANGKRTLGSGTAAFTVSAMGFGCMGLNYHRSEHLGEEAAIKLVHEAIDRGVTLFDTAESYGPFTNEKLMGKALKGYGGRVFVTSKFGHKFINGIQVKTEEDSSPANIRKVCENSLRSLGVETLGIFYQHRSDPATPIEVVAETVAELIKEGKVLHFGLCEVNADTIRPRTRCMPRHSDTERIPPDAPHCGRQRAATVRRTGHRLRAIQPNQPRLSRRTCQRAHEIQQQRQPPNTATLPAGSHTQEPAHSRGAKRFRTHTRLHSGTNIAGLADEQS